MAFEVTGAGSQGPIRGVMAMEADLKTLRGLIAPEVSPAGFEAMVDEAEAAEQQCLARAS